MKLRKLDTKPIDDLDVNKESNSNESHLGDKIKGFWVGVTSKFKKDDSPDEMLTFQHKQAKFKKEHRKRIVVWSLLGLTALSTVMALAMPILNNINISKPSVETTDKSVEEVKSSLTDVSTSSTSEATGSTETGTSDGMIQEELDAKIQEAVNAATSTLVSEYNAKLDEATQKIQDANAATQTVTAERDTLKSQVSTLTSERDALQKELDALKASQSTSSNTVDIPE